MSVEAEALARLIWIAGNPDKFAENLKRIQEATEAHGVALQKAEEAQKTAAEGLNLQMSGYAVLDARKADLDAREATLTAKDAEIKTTVDATLSHKAALDEREAAIAKREQSIVLNATVAMEPVNARAADLVTISGNLEKKTNALNDREADLVLREKAAGDLRAEYEAKLAKLREHLAR